MSEDKSFRGAVQRLPDEAAGAEVIQIAGPQMSAITQYLRILFRRRWLIVFTIAAVLIAALILTLLTTRQYTAASSIEIQREGDRVVKLEGVEREAGASDLEFYQTQYGLLKARSLAVRVARTMRLGNNRRFIDAYKLDSSLKTLRTEESRLRLLSDILLSNLKVTPVRASRLVTLAYTSPDPSLAAGIANAWGQNFIESNLERRFESTAYARKFLEGRLVQLRERLESSERDLVNYAGTERIINLPATTITGNGQQTTGERSIVADDLAALNVELGAATADRIKAESRLRGSRGGTSPEALSNQTIAILRQRRAEVEADYAKLMVQFEPGYPQVRALAGQLSQLESAIAREEGRVRESISANYQESQQRENALQRKVESLKSGLLDLRRRSIQYNIYQREVDTNRQLYDGLLQRYKEIGIAGGVGNNNVSIVDRAEIPQVPSKPNLFTNLLLAMFIGTGLGVAIAFALEQVDEAITDPEDVQRSIGLPLLGVVPNLQDVEPIVALRDRKSSLAEAYLSIQTSLEFSTAHGAPRSIAITSTRPAEGKSSSAYALAQTMARARRKVVLIDCDMRSPSVHQLFGLDRGTGVSNYLTGSDDLQSLLRATDIDNLAVVTAGPQPPNAAELLTGDRLRQLIDSLLESFDHVVIDAPPVMGLADAPLIASKVEATVFVVESHSIRTSLVNRAVARLSAANAHLVGVILSRFDVKRAHYGYGYDYGYGYGDARSDGRTSSLAAD